jgi:hypothetical protein
MSKKRSRPLWLDLWLIISLISWLLLGAIAGMRINKHIYERERGETNAHEASQSNPAMTGSGEKLPDCRELTSGQN